MRGLVLDLWRLQERTWVGDMSMDCAWRWRHQANSVAVLLMGDLAGRAWSHGTCVTGGVKTPRWRPLMAVVVVSWW